MPTVIGANKEEFDKHQMAKHEKLRIRPYSKEEMLSRGADGFLSKGYERYIPLHKLSGLEPTPSNNLSPDGKYHKGVKITQPIETHYDKDNDVYHVYGGNHRIAQAHANGQSHILSFVESNGPLPDHAKRENPDNQPKEPQ